MDTPCLEWDGRFDKRGYGVVYFQGRKTMAHRAAWIKRHGPIPDDLTVDHLCFNTACVETDHMRLLTHLENSRNQRSAYKTHCVNGHEYTPENTYARSASGGRDCRACIRNRAARYQARRRAA